MPRYAIKVEYDGTPFAGWQRQDGPPTVQGAIEDALAKIAPERPLVQGAGRTDAGVHALAQVAHLDMARDWDPFRLSEALNFHLKPLPIAVLDAAQVQDDWHARFSAIERAYLYRLVERRAPLTHDAHQVWRVGHGLDAEAMHVAAQHLIGKHDFTTFRSSMCQAESPVKTLDDAAVTSFPYPGGTEYQFTFRARSFLHNQVRSFVGTLERVGAGAWQPERVKAVLDAADRTQCGPVAPPDGLYLTGVRYEDDPFKKS